MSFHLANDQQLPLSATPLAASGKTGSILSAPTWSLSDPTLADFAPGADADSIVLVPKDGAAGDVTVTVEAQVDHGAGAQTLSAKFPLTITQPEAATIQIQPGDAVSKPAAAASPAGSAPAAAGDTGSPTAAPAATTAPASA